MFGLLALAEWSKLQVLSKHPNEFQGVQLLEKDQKGPKYSAPKLTVYGDMAAITAGGSMGPAEGTAMRPDMARP